MSSKRLLSAVFRGFSSQVRSEYSYKAAVLKEPGKPLEIEERKRPKLGENQVRVQISYCSVNSGDCAHLRSRTDVPFVPGYEFSGEVIETGTNVKPEQVLKGEKVGGLSVDSFGAFAQECVVTANDVWRLPNNVCPKDAAVIISAHSLAMLAFSKFIQPAKDEKVVVTAGPAGLGLAAVDVAANVYGAKVIGVTDSEETGELLRKIGAFRTLHFDKNLQKGIFKATDNKGASIIYDAVGTHMLATIGSCAAFGGRIFHAADADYKNIPVPSPNSSVTILNLRKLKTQDLETYKCLIYDTLEMADQGAIGAHISRSFELQDVNKAIEFIESKQCTGKVVICMDVD